MINLFKQKKKIMPTIDFLLKLCTESQDAVLQTATWGELYQGYDAICQKWDNLIRVSLWKWTLAYFACFYVDMVVSWEIYREFLHSIVANPQTWQVIGMGCFVNGMALVLAELVSKHLSSGLYRIEVENALDKLYKTEDSNSFVTPLMAEYKVNKDKEQEILFAVVLFTIMVGVIYLFADQRTQLLKVIYHRNDLAFEVTQKLIPVLVFCAEIMAGIYMGYTVRRWILGWKCLRAESKKQKAISKALKLDNLAFNHYLGMKLTPELGNTLRLINVIDAMVARCQNRIPVEPPKVKAVEKEVALFIETDEPFAQIAIPNRNAVVPANESYTSFE
jgi:hypothetical protein